MDLIEINKALFDSSSRLNKASKEVFRLAREKAENERLYRLALAQEMTKLRAEGQPANLTYDMAKGNVADLLYARDLSEGLFKAAQLSMRALETEISAYQSILKTQSEV